MLHGEGPHVARLRSNGIVTRGLSSSKFALHEIILRLAARLRCRDYDILHLHLPASSLIGCFLAWFFANAPVFVTVYAVKNQLRWPAYYGFRLIAPLVTKFITIVQISRAELRSIGVSDDKICYLPMGLDFESANPGRHDEVRRTLAATYGFDPGRPLLLSVARLARDRHIHTLVDAMTDISNACPDALLLMVGDGDQRAELERTVRQRGLDRNVIFAKPRPDVWNVMPGCDVYLSAATGHDIGVAALQAMACARPVAAYDLLAMPEEQELRSDQGMFIAARDARALARIVCALVHDKDKASVLGAKARQHVTECGSLSAMIRGYDNVYITHAHQFHASANAKQSDSAL